MISRRVRQSLLYVLAGPSGRAQTVYRGRGRTLGMDRTRSPCVQATPRTAPRRRGTSLALDDGAPERSCRGARVFAKRGVAAKDWNPAARPGVAKAATGERHRRLDRDGTSRRSTERLDRRREPLPLSFPSGAHSPSRVDPETGRRNSPSRVDDCGRVSPRPARASCTRHRAMHRQAILARDLRPLASFPARSWIRNTSRGR